MALLATCLVLFATAAPHALSEPLDGSELRPTVALPDVHGGSEAYPSSLPDVHGGSEAHPSSLPDVHGGSAAHPSSLPEVHGGSEVDPSTLDGDGPESRVRRTPEVDSLVLGMPNSRGSCKYAPVYGYLSADCSDRGFEGIPALRPGVEALDMSENKMKSVLNSTLAGLANLRYLYLNENRIKLVEAGALVMLRYLEVIDLSGNRLQSIPHGLMELPRLRKLYFADNLLERLDPAFVFASPTLQLLQLAECNLPDLPLGDMPELLHLNVSRNALTSLPLHDLAKMCRLVILDLSHMSTTLFEELDMEEACQCQTFQRWSRLRELDLGRGTKIVCRNNTNSADDQYSQSCNATQVATSALELHGRCVRAQQQELRAQMRGWWVIAMSVACATVLVSAVLLCFCQRRKSEPRHHKVPVVVIADDSNGNSVESGHGHGVVGRGPSPSRPGGGRSTPDGK